MAKLRPLKRDLLEELKCPEFAVSYLADALEEGDQEGFLLALRDVVEALGGVGKLAKDTDLHRVGIYKALSEHGNPQFSTVLQTMSALGLSFKPFLFDKKKFRTKAKVLS